MNELREILMAQYGIAPASIAETPGGFSAKAYRVVGEDGIAYFLKVYDARLPTTRVFVERIDAYMPVLDALSDAPTLRGRVLTPVRTKTSKYKAEFSQNVYVLFLFVDGRVPGIDGMTLFETRELAQTLARLHEVKLRAPALSEDISLPFADRLSAFLNAPGALSPIALPHAELLRAAIRQVIHLRDTRRAGHSKLVLCHGDAHGNNVIYADRLVLADWEDLRVAPAEADLFIHAWHPHGDALLSAYREARRGFEIDRELLYFYTLRRRIEDIWVDIERLTEEEPDEAEAEKLRGYIALGIDAVRTLFS